MDINKTINLLQSQMQNTPTGFSKEQSLPKTTPETTAGGEEASVKTNGTNSDTTNTANPQQTTGAEFSTFLTLLTAQIRNQDPLAPLDSTQFVEQLATFSNLELQAKGNQSLELISALLARQIELLTPSEEPETGPASAIDTAA
ncbi:MAG: hypothetical protein JKY25_08275 [Robiginitomaculum sp.]|nr:hypothetical protein [Robiginitomaculum sp.]